jgi:hypothetical protein
MTEVAMRNPEELQTEDEEMEVRRDLKHVEFLPIPT